MRAETLKRIHEGHLGASKCKARARQSVCWPGMSAQIETMVSRCETCARLKASKPKEPMLISEVPTGPWKKVGTDLFQIGTKYYIVVVAYYSLWPEVYKLRDISSKCVISALKQSFSRYGVPEVLYSDNGPQYTARTFKKFIS